MVLLQKTVVAEFSTLCANVKVDNLIKYCEELVELVVLEMCLVPGDKRGAHLTIMKPDIMASTP
jgi:hypothetical protein